jgi:YegS/Rv2252/BmrU family lipid kinase
MDMKKTLLIVNPVAGRQKIRNALVDVVDVLVKAGHEITIYTTQKDVDPKDLIRDKQGQYDYVVCSGGDGTFSELLSETMHWEPRPILGYIPCGTTNDFAAGLGLPTDCKMAAMEIAAGEPRVFDAGKLNDRYFSYVASFGAFTDVSYQTPQDLKNNLGYLAYLLESIKELTAIKEIPVRIETEDQVYEDSYVFGAITNARTVGGMFKLSDSLVDLNDGLLEVMMIRMPRTPMDLSALITAINSMNYDSSMFLHFQARSLKITSQTPLEWTVDGEHYQGQGTDEILCIKDAFRLMMRNNI